MSELTSQPSNMSFLSPLKFGFNVAKLPNVNFFCQSVLLPAVTIPKLDIPTPFVKIPQPGDHIDFGEMQITFRVDEDMKNYIEVFNWISALGSPSDFEAYKNLQDNERRQTPLGTQEIVSDASLLIFNSAANPNIEIKFKGLFPSTISELTLDLRAQDVMYIECVASFNYEQYEIIPL